MEKIIKSTTIKAEKVEKRVLRFIGSTQDVDRDGDRIMLDGWDLKEYKKNPVVLFGHDQHAEPVARTKKVWIDPARKSLMFDVEFPEPEVSSKGDSLYKLYKAGYMAATSVSFLPDFSKVTYPNKTNNKGPYRVFNGQSLTELSLVSIGANARALLTSKSIESAIEKEVIDQLELDELLSCLREEKEVVIADDKNEIIKNLKLKIEELEFELKNDTEEGMYEKTFDEYKDKTWEDKLIAEYNEKDNWIDEILEEIKE